MELGVDASEKADGKPEGRVQWQAAPKVNFPEWAR